MLVVAAFGVLNIIIMAVIERVNDIAILRASPSRHDVTLVYVFQGLVIGLVGSVVGRPRETCDRGAAPFPIKMDGPFGRRGL